MQDLKERFGLQRVVFVGDRGMTDSTVREALEAAGCGYLVGIAAAAAALIPSVACCRRNPCFGRHPQQTKADHGDCRRPPD